MPLDDATPQLSANGQSVAILSTQPAMGQDPDCFNDACGQGDPQTTNAYIVNMADGLSRSAALTRLTEWAANSFSQTPLSGSVDDIAISPDGDRVAFVTARSVFPFSPPALTTPQLISGTVEQLYVADLTDGTLQAATIGYDGLPANRPVMEPSFSANYGPIAFASAATNLVYGAFSDVGGGYQVFTMTELKPPAIPGVTYISPPPPNPAVVPDWELSATAERGPHGSILLWVSVPGAGRLAATADANVPIRRLGFSRARIARLESHGRKVVKVTLARAEAGPGGAGVVELRLVPGDRYDRAIGPRGLYATVRLTFAEVGQAPLAETLGVDFKGAGHNPRAKAQGHKPRSARNGSWRGR
jgi:hypothetical protein